LWNHEPNSALIFGTSNLERLRIAADGKIGVGTITPTSNFHIHAGTVQDIRMQFTAATFSGNLSGNATSANSASSATTATTAQGLTGTPSITVNDITSTGNITTGTSYVGGGSYYIGPRRVIWTDGGTSGKFSFEHGEITHLSPGYIYGANVQGNLSVTGSKQWRIEHPILNDKDLIHSCIEGPRADNLYRGRAKLINGECIVNIDSECNTTGGMADGTFVLINKNIQVFVNNNETFDRVIGKIEGNKLHIKCENINVDNMIDWLVICERNDKGMINHKDTAENGSIIVELDRDINKPTVNPFTDEPI